MLTFASHLYYLCVCYHCCWGDATYQQYQTDVDSSPPPLHRCLLFYCLKGETKSVYPEVIEHSNHSFIPCRELLDPRANLEKCCDSSFDLSTCKKEYLCKDIREPFLGCYVKYLVKYLKCIHNFVIKQVLCPAVRSRQDMYLTRDEIL